MSGVVSVIILTVIQRLIMNAKNPFNAGLIALPVIYGLTIFINVLTVTLNGSKRNQISLTNDNNFHKVSHQFSPWKILKLGKFLPSAFPR